MASPDEQVAVIGGGVVGCALAYELARRGVAAPLIEAEDELATGASGSNSGILHTGFDSKPGELETELILRAGELRERQLGALGVPVLRCGALLRADGPEPGARAHHPPAARGVRAPPRAGALASVRGERRPARNGLSEARARRPAARGRAPQRKRGSYARGAA